MDWFPSARQSQHLFRPEDAGEEVYRITGTDRSLSSNPVEFDDKAVEELHQINLTGRDAVEVHNDFLDLLEPEDIPGDRLFLHQDDPYLSLCGYRGLKQTYAYHKGDRKTNWIMNIYSPITGDVMKAHNIVLCHVFQSDGSYDPWPKRGGYLFENLIARNYMESLEALLLDPNAFKDSDECHENSGAYSAPKANGSKGKRSTVWETFTEIKVLGPNGEVVLTLAICHHCSMAYKTGGLKPKRKGSTELVFKNNGTKTMEEHKGRCSGHQHTAGNPQGVLP